MTKYSLDEVEAALLKVSAGEPEFTDEEIVALRDVLEWWRMWKAWGRLGKFLLWIAITMGAVAAAFREVQTWLR